MKKASVLPRVSFVVTGYVEKVAWWDGSRPIVAFYIYASMYFFIPTTSLSFFIFHLPPPLLVFYFLHFLIPTYSKTHIESFK